MTAAIAMTPMQNLTKLVWLALLVATSAVVSARSQVVAAAPVALPSQQASPALAPADLDAYVERAMATFDVPGLALSVVKDGKVIVAKGYGVRRLGEPSRVDAQTLFGIASNTKVVTAAALGLLVEERPT